MVLPAKHLATRAVTRSLRASRVAGGHVLTPGTRALRGGCRTSCGGRGCAPEERSVCGYDPDLAPGRLGVPADRDENGDARVVHPVQITEVEHGHLGDPLIEEELDGVGQVHGRRKPEGPRHAHDQCAFSPVMFDVEPGRRRILIAPLPGLARATPPGARRPVVAGVGVVGHWLSFAGVWQRYRRARQRTRSADPGLRGLLHAVLGKRSGRADAVLASHPNGAGGTTKAGGALGTPSTSRRTTQLVDQFRVHAPHRG
jgi:hypothetical protein